jgi:hypothetical protein
MADKVIELLRLMEKFGVKPGKIIGAGDRKVTPIKKPILSKPLNRDYLLEDVKEEKIGINTVKNEIEDIAPLFFQKQLNDVEINNLLNNLNYLDSLLNPTNIIDITTKAPVKGLESLKPTSITGGLERAGKQLEEVGKKLEETTKPKSVIGEIMSDYASFQKIMQEENKKGLVRATTRSILYQDIKDGKIKGMTFEQLGSAKDPIEDFRKIYGEDALEQLNTLTDDFSQMRTPEEAANFAKTKFKFEPRTSDLPETTTIEEAKKAEQEFGINKPEDLKPEGIVIPFRKKITEPEEFADGGITRTKFATGGKGKKILDIIKKANKDLKGKKSMETVNPKTGEVTVADEFVTTSEQQLNKKRQLTREEIEDYEEQLGDSETWMSEGTVEEAEKALKRSKAEEAYYYRQYKAGKLDPEPGENSQSRMRFLRKKAEEAEMTGDRRLISSDEMDELSDLESTYLEDVDEAYGIDTAIKKEMKKAMEEGTQKTNRMTELGLDPSSSKDYDKFLEMESIKQKYGNVIDDNLLQQILVDDNPQRKAEVLASIDEAIKMQQRGIAPEEIINIIKNTTRTKQAKGGSVGLNYLMGF